MLSSIFILGKPFNMALLMLLGYLVCNVVLAWATLQQPYISKSLSIPPPKNLNNWVHLVIFKPQLKIQLCLSWISNPFFEDFSLLIIIYITHGQMLIIHLIFDIYFYLLLMY